MRADFADFEPTHKVILSTNHRPEIRGTDRGMWRRILLVPFAVSIPDKDQDRDLPAKLLGERSGILNWLLAGCLAYRAEGLNPPEEVQRATQEYRTAEDLVEAFLEEKCVVRRGDEHHRCRAKELYRAYAAWCAANGEEAGTQRQFGDILTAKGFGVMRSNGKWRLGVALKEVGEGAAGQA
jgi:putative DNA primase/helicase